MPVSSSSPMIGLFEGSTTGSPAMHAPALHRVPALHAEASEKSKQESACCSHCATPPSIQVATPWVQVVGQLASDNPIDAYTVSPSTGVTRSTPCAHDSLPRMP